jgi:hypothetical protein
MYFVKEPRPSMTENQGNCVLMCGPLMNEMNRHFAEILDFNWNCELRELVYFGFVSAPLIVVEPMVRKAFDFSDWCAV